ncbi:MAG: FAD-binding oxidoreductase [Solirubrobacterales bacterium]|nr:FAD-binding oxidoreductase [Solirubrobacterales bacterium]
MEPRRDTRWWGWGNPDERAELPPAAERMLVEREILTGATIPGIRDIEEVELPPAGELPSDLLETAGPLAVSVSPEDRIRHAAGQSYLDLLALRSGVLERAPDAVITPASAEAIAPILEVSARERVAVVPFGGGTSVVGGVAPLRGECDLVIALDLVNLRGIEIDRTSLTARLGAGLRGPEAEALLGADGLTLGHFPQSFEYATIGGFAATRSAGQSSSGYGRFDSMVTGVSLVTPEGVLSTGPTPHTSIGPSLRELIIGSEGMLGVIPEVEVRVRPTPAQVRREAWIAESFEAGNEIVRELAQSGDLPAVIRVSDRNETEVSLAMSSPSGLAGTAFRRYLEARKRSDGALMIVSYEGTAEDCRHRRSVVARALRKGGAVNLGQSGGRGWARGRFHGPYLRETLLDRGVLVETFETATSWSRHPELYRRVSEAVDGAMGSQKMKGVLMCHLSHAYPDGASLYFTVIASPGPAGGAHSWPAVKTAALDAIQANGGTLSHHHATGRDHRPRVAGEIGPLGAEVLQAAKDRLDPAGIMNPGKLLP